MPAKWKSFLAVSRPANKRFAKQDGTTMSIRFLTRLRKLCHFKPETFKDAVPVDLFHDKGHVILVGRSIYVQPSVHWRVSFSCHHCWTDYTFPENISDIIALNAITMIRANVMAGKSQACMAAPFKHWRYFPDTPQPKTCFRSRINLTSRTFRKPGVHEFDTEFNPLPPGIDYTPPAPLTAEELKEKEDQTDEQIYLYFSEFLNATLAEPTETISGNMKTPIDIGYIDDAYLRLKPYATKTEKYPYGEPYITAFPKWNGITSDGKIRNTFPCSSAVIAFLDKNVGNPEPKIPYTLRKKVDFVAPFRSYDINTSDKNILPYYSKWVKEYRPPEEWKYFLPKYICKINGTLLSGYPPQFPSGMTLTRQVSPCFAAAILKANNIVEAQIQGDGIALPTTAPILNIPLLRREADNEINGFRYHEASKPQYLNAVKRLSSIRLKTKTLNGTARFEFRRAIYIRLLNCVEQHSLPSRNEQLAKDYLAMDIKELIALAHHHEEVWQKSYISIDSGDIAKQPHTLTYISGL